MTAIRRSSRPHTASRVSRRRFLCITGVAASLSAGIPLAQAASNGGVTAGANASPFGADTLHEWQGIALGADATLRIHHPDAAHARRLIEHTVLALRRMEQLFSLYSPDSQLSRLNRDGTLDDPAADMVALLQRSQRFSALTNGAFDITVQPLWQVYAEHFLQAAATPEGPPAHAIADALRRVDYRLLDVGSRQVRFQRPGMAITLNGIAQGYVTDRITDLLAQGGIEHALVNMGEIRGMNAPSGPDWRVGLERAGHPGQITDTITLRNAAIATSGGYGTPLDLGQRFHHLFDPASGDSSRRYLGVSVLAANATTADALSTAFSLMSETDIQQIVRSTHTDARLTLPNHQIVLLRHTA